MIDTNAIKQDIDLLALIPGEFRRMASTGGGEYVGPCPFCGGRDRLHIQPEHESGGRWFCRKCQPILDGGGWHDAIDFVMRRDNVDFREASAILGGEQIPGPAPIRPEQPGPDSWDYWQAKAAAAAVNPAGWEEAAIMAVAESGAALRDYPAVLRYLRDRRGLTDETIRIAGLGYNPRPRKIGDYWLEAGITIPYLNGRGKFSAINVRTTKSRQDQGRPKYQTMAGSVKGDLFNVTRIDSAVRSVVICESEFDSLLLGQFLPDEWAAVATGGATIIDKIAGLALARVHWLYLCFDNDAAGDQARAAWSEIRPDSAEFRVPDTYNDITEYWQAGGDLAALAATP